MNRYINVTILYTGLNVVNKGILAYCYIQKGKWYKLTEV